MYAWNLDAMANNQVSLIIGANSQVGQIPGYYCKQPSRSQALMLDAYNQVLSFN